MARETPAERKRRARVLLNRLKKLYPGARTALDHSSALELLVATILSAQCTDERVNKVTPTLFRRFPKASDYATAERAELEERIRSTGFYRNKAKSIQGAAQAIVEKFSGEVPETMEELLQLPGVARKTANVVLGNYFGKATGVVVDTHVQRLARRLGLSQAKTAEQVEEDLMALYPPKDWIALGNVLILHGRNTCSARQPQCDTCPLASHCPQIDAAAPSKAKGKKKTTRHRTAAASRRR